MVLRTARRGDNAGKQFWGCSEFPKCRQILPYEATALALTLSDNPSTSSGAGIQQSTKERRDSNLAEKPEGLLSRSARTVDKGWRWYLESDEPDASGRWDDTHRRRILSYIYRRDGGRCGLCAGEMKLKGAQIEHIVPEIFAVFDIR